MRGRKGLASTTVRDVAAEMGTSSGLIHHYFDSMDEVLAAAFERVARRTWRLSARLMAEAASPVEALRVFFRTYTPADKDWAFQLWLDAWAEAARRPARPGDVPAAEPRVAGAAGADDRAGVAAGAFTCPDPAGAAWRILSLLDGLALQVVAHGTTISRGDVVAWSTAAAERELGLAAGTLRLRREGPCLGPRLPRPGPVGPSDRVPGHHHRFVAAEPFLSDAPPTRASGQSIPAICIAMRTIVTTNDGATPPDPCSKRGGQQIS